MAEENIWQDDHLPTPTPPKQSWTQKGMQAVKTMSQNQFGSLANASEGSSDAASVNLRRSQVKDQFLNRQWGSVVGDLTAGARNAGTGAKRAEGAFKSQPISPRYIGTPSPLRASQERAVRNNLRGKGSSVASSDTSATGNSSTVQPGHVGENPTPPSLNTKPVPSAVAPVPPGGPAPNRLTGPSDMFAPKSNAYAQQGSLFGAPAAGNGDPEDLGFGTQDQYEKFKDPFKERASFE